MPSITSEDSKIFSFDNISQTESPRESSEIRGIRTALPRWPRTQAGARVETKREVKSRVRGQV